MTEKSDLPYFDCLNALLKLPHPTTDRSLEPCTEPRGSWLASEVASTFNRCSD